MRGTYAQSIRRIQLSRQFNEIGSYAPEHTLGPTIRGPCLAAIVPKGTGYGALWRDCINDAWGVRTKAAPGGRDGQDLLHERWGNRRRRRRRSGATAAIERQRSAAKCARQCRGKCGRAPTGAPARVPRAMRAALRRDRRSSRCTSALCNAAASSGRRERERGAKRARGRRGHNDRVDGRRNGPRRRQRRRARRVAGQAERAAPEGCGGARDRSGFGASASEWRYERRARSRSDAPGSIAASGTTFTMVCTRAGNTGGRIVGDSADVGAIDERQREQGERRARTAVRGWPFGSAPGAGPRRDAACAAHAAARCPALRGVSRRAPGPVSQRRRQARARSLRRA